MSLSSCGLVDRITEVVLMVPHCCCCDFGARSSVRLVEHILSRVVVVRIASCRCCCGHISESYCFGVDEYRQMDKL
jgi:hypothetical protein